MARMTREEYIQFQKETVAKSRGVYQKALRFCPDLFTENNYAKFLQFLTKWNHFSAINIILLYMQYPNASYVAGFQRWQKIAKEQGFDRNHKIIKEEYQKRGITLLIPFSFFNNYNNESLKIKEERFLTYKSILVFDVSQINNIAPAKCFSPYVPINHLDAAAIIALLRKQFQNDISFIVGRSDAIGFKYHHAYLFDNTIYYLDSAPADQKIIAIFEEIIRFMAYQYPMSSKEKDFVRLSVLYCILDYFGFPNKQLKFSYFDFLESNSSDRLLCLIHFICSIVQEFIYRIHKGYLEFLEINGYDTDDPVVESIIAMLKE